MWDKPLRQYFYCVTDLESYPPIQANPKLATQKDDDGRLPIHWAVSYGQNYIVLLLAQMKDFDPDVEVGSCVQVQKADPWHV